MGFFERVLVPETELLEVGEVRPKFRRRFLLSDNSKACRDILVLEPLLEGVIGVSIDRGWYVVAITRGFLAPTPSFVSSFQCQSSPDDE